MRKMGKSNELFLRTVYFILAGSATATFTIRGADGLLNSNRTLQSFHMVEYNISSWDVYLINASEVLLVAHISRTCDADNAGSTNGDPSMVFLRPVDRPDLLSSAYRFLTPQTSNFLDVSYNTLVYTDYSNYPNVVINTPATAGLLRDGILATTDRTDVGASGFSGAQIPVSPGAHAITHNAGIKFAVYLYGNAYMEAYATAIAAWNTTDTNDQNCGQISTTVQSVNASLYTSAPQPIAMVNNPGTTHKNRNNNNENPDNFNQPGKYPATSNIVNVTVHRSINNSV